MLITKEDDYIITDFVKIDSEEEQVITDEEELKMMHMNERMWV